MNNSAAFVLGLAIPSLPFLAVSITGLMFSLSRRRLYPRAARWATAGFTCWLLEIGLSVLQQYMFGITDLSATEREGLFWMFPTMYLLKLSAFVLITVAVFVERQHAQQSAPGDVRNARA